MQGEYKKDVQKKEHVCKSFILCALRGPTSLTFAVIYSKHKRL